MVGRCFGKFYRPDIKAGCIEVGYKVLARSSWLSLHVH